MVAPLVKRIWIWCRNLLIFLFVSSILAVMVYKFVPVYYTPLMFIRMYEQHQDGEKKKKMKMIYMGGILVGSGGKWLWVKQDKGGWSDKRRKA